MEPEPPTDGRAKTIVVTIAEAAISAVPIIGGPVATLLSGGIATVVGQRRQVWFAELARTVEQLSAHIDELQPERLAESDAFADAVMTAARIVEKTSQQEKLDVLRNAVVNSVMPGAPNVDVRASYFAIVDDFTPSHLRLLTLFDDPSGWFDSRPDLSRPKPALSSHWHQLVDAALPELAGEIADRFLADLSSNGLVLISSLSGQMTATGIWARVTSGYGQRFLAFIAEPVVPA
jgi:outer membrane murein-binding lipoprotein Lpp